MKAKQVLRIVGNALIWLVFALSLLTVILSLSSSGGGVPNIFGTGYLTVQSDSMSGTFEVGDMIIVNTTAEDDVFEELDIVTFWTIIEGEQVLNTHRIISYSTINGTRYYTTQGDNCAESDPLTVTAGDIVAIYTGTKLTGIGNVMDYVQSQTGFLICIVLPLAGIFIYQIVNFVLVILKFKKENAPETAGNVAIDELTAEQKEEIARKYLESLNASKEKDKEEK